MRLMLAASAALAVLAMAAPAQADDRYERSGYGRYEGGRYERDWRPAFTREDLSRLQWRIDRGFEQGRLTRSEARRLSAELGDLRRQTRYYWQNDGRIGRRERRVLEERYYDLRDRLRYELRDDDRRYRRY